MPLICDVGYEDRMLDAQLPEPATFTRWLVKRSDMLSAAVAVAVLEMAGVERRVYLRFPCLVDRLVAEPGDSLHLGSVLLAVQADDENVPEGCRYGYLD